MSHSTNGTSASAFEPSPLQDTLTVLLAVVGIVANSVLVRATYQRGSKLSSNSSRLIALCACSDILTGFGYIQVGGCICAIGRCPRCN